MTSTFTTNLQLEKPGLGDPSWGAPVNANMDEIDTQIGGLNALVGDIPFIERFSGTFNGSTGTAHTLGTAVDAVTEYGVKITPTSRAGAIGDVYVTKTTTGFTVKCSETNTTDTYEATVYYTPDASQFGGSVYRRWIVSPDSSITDHSNASTNGSLAYVLAQVSGTPAVVELPGNRGYDITALDVTVPSNVKLEIQPGAIITVASTKTLTINGPFSAHPLQECFDGAGTVVFGSGAALMLHAAWFGMPSGGNDAAKLEQALDSGLPIYFHTGTYLLTTFTHTLAADLQLFGPADRSAILDADDASYFTTAAAASEILLHNLTFKDWAPVVNIQSALDRFEMVGCEVDSCDAAVRHDGSYLGVQVAEVYCARNYIHDCAFGFEFEGYNYQNVVIRENRIEDLASATAAVCAIQVGSDSWTNRDSGQKFVIAENVIDDIDMTDTTTHETHGIYVFAREAVIANNIIKNVDAPNIGTANGCEGIYTKVRYGQITGNVLVDAGFNEGAITVKGRTRATGGVDYRHPGWNIVVAYNNISFSSGYHDTPEWDARGIAISACEDVLVAHNYIDGATEYGIFLVEDGDGYDVDNIAIDGNTVRNTRGNCAIYMDGDGSNWRVSNNHILVVTGERSTTGNAVGILVGTVNSDISGVSVKGNSILIDNNCVATNGIMGVQIITRDHAYENIAIKDNDFRLSHASVNTRGVDYYDYAGSDGMIDKMSIIGNDMHGLTYPVSVNYYPDNLVVANNPGFNRASRLTTDGGGAVGAGTTAGYARTTQAIEWSIGTVWRSLNSTDNLWNLTGISTGSSEYKKVLLSLNTSSAAVVIEGEAASSQALAEVPIRRFDAAVIAIVEIPNNYSGGSISGFEIHDIVGVWPD